MEPPIPLWQQPIDPNVLIPLPDELSKWELTFEGYEYMVKHGHCFPFAGKAYRKHSIPVILEEIEKRPHLWKTFDKKEFHEVAFKVYRRTGELLWPKAVVNCFKAYTTSLKACLRVAILKKKANPEETEERLWNNFQYYGFFRFYRKILEETEESWRRLVADEEKEEVVKKEQAQSEEKTDEPRRITLELRKQSVETRKSARIRGKEKSLKPCYKEDSDGEDFFEHCGDAIEDLYEVSSDESDHESKVDANGTKKMKKKTAIKKEEESNDNHTTKNENSKVSEKLRGSPLPVSPVPSKTSKTAAPSDALEKTDPKCPTSSDGSLERNRSAQVIEKAAQTESGRMEVSSRINRPVTNVSLVSTDVTSNSFNSVTMKSASEQDGSTSEHIKIMSRTPLDRHPTNVNKTASESATEHRPGIKSGPQNMESSANPASSVLGHSKMAVLFNEAPKRTEVPLPRPVQFVDTKEAREKLIETNENGPASKRPIVMAPTSNASINSNIRASSTLKSTVNPMPRFLNASQASVTLPVTSVFPTKVRSEELKTTNVQKTFAVSQTPEKPRIPVQPVPVYSRMPHILPTAPNSARSLPLGFRSHVSGNVEANKKQLETDRNGFSSRINGSASIGSLVMPTTFPAAHNLNAGVMLNKPCVNPNPLLLNAMNASVTLPPTLMQSSPANTNVHRMDEKNEVSQTPNNAFDPVSIFLPFNVQAGGFKPIPDKMAADPIKTSPPRKISEHTEILSYTPRQTLPVDKRLKSQETVGDAKNGTENLMKPSGGFITDHRLLDVFNPNTFEGHWRDAILKYNWLQKMVDANSSDAEKSQTLASMITAMNNGKPIELPQFASPADYIIPSNFYYPFPLCAPKKLRQQPSLSASDSQSSGQSSPLSHIESPGTTLAGSQNQAERTQTERKRNLELEKSDQPPFKISPTVSFLPPENIGKSPQFPINTVPVRETSPTRNVLIAIERVIKSWSPTCDLPEDKIENEFDTRFMIMTVLMGYQPALPAEDKQYNEHRARLVNECMELIISFTSSMSTENRAKFTTMFQQRYNKHIVPLFANCA